MISVAFKLKIGGVEYVINLPAYAIPYVNLLGNKFAAVPDNFEDAKQLAEDLKTAIDELERFIQPTPNPDHWPELLFKLIIEVANEIRRAVRAAGFSAESMEAR